MVPPCSLRVPRARRYSRYRLSLRRFAYRTVTVSGLPFKTRSTTTMRTLSCSYPSYISIRSLASSNFARHYFRNLVWFLFLRLLRCFSSAGSLYSTMDSCYSLQFFTTGVAPFGDPRVKAYFQLTVAYRRLSRPSSALGAKAFTLCSFSLEQLVYSCSLNLLFCLSFANNCFGFRTHKKTIFFFWIPLFSTHSFECLAKLYLSFRITLTFGKTF